MVAAALPTTLAMLFREFFRQHAEEKLAPKTIERYREQGDRANPGSTGIGNRVGNRGVVHGYIPGGRGRHRRTAR